MKPDIPHVLIVAGVLLWLVAFAWSFALSVERCATVVRVTDSVPVESVAVDGVPILVAGVAYTTWLVTNSGDTLVSNAVLAPLGTRICPIDERWKPL